jgi:hypothetical protein
LISRILHGFGRALTGGRPRLGSRASLPGAGPSWSLGPRGKRGEANFGNVLRFWRVRIPRLRETRARGTRDALAAGGSRRSGWDRREGRACERALPVFKDVKERRVPRGLPVAAWPRFSRPFKGRVAFQTSGSLRPMALAPGNHSTRFLALSDFGRSRPFSALLDLTRANSNRFCRFADGRFCPRMSTRARPPTRLAILPRRLDGHGWTTRRNFRRER